jgi:hypothetical protein
MPDAPLPPEPPPAPPPAPAEAPEPGSVPGLYSPTLQERACEIDRCMEGQPETEVQLIDPTGRYVIPYTGQWDPWEREIAFFAAETVTYDSNIFATEHDVEDDFISNTSVGAAYRREGARFWVLGTASVTYQAYLDHDDQNTLNVFGDFQAGWRGSCSYVSLEDQLIRSESPVVLRDNNFLVVSQDLDAYWQNTLTVRAGYDAVKWRAELSNRFEFFEAESGLIQDFNHVDDAIRARADYYVSEKTSVGALAQVRFVDYDEDAQFDFTEYTVAATFSWRPTAKLGVNGHVGFSSLDSDGGEDEDDVTGGVDVAWEAGENVSVTFSYARDFQAALSAASQFVDSFRVGLHSQVGCDWTVSAAAGYQIGDLRGNTVVGTDQYEFWHFEVLGHRAIGCRFAFDAGVEYRTENASGSGADFDQIRVTVGFSASL